MGCCLTSWFSKKQTALAISTTEVEYVSAEKACQQALWMKQALIGYGIRLDDIPIMCDNKGAIDLSKNPVQHSRTKHIEIHHYFLRENVQKGNISIEKLNDVKGKAIMKEVVVKLEDDKSSDDDTSKDSHDYMLEDSSKDLINFLSSRDLQWQSPKQSHEEDPLPIDVPMQTEEEDPLPHDIVYLIQEIASSSRDTSRRGEPRYGLRSLGPIQEEVVMVKDGCSGSGRKRNS
ncbi:hypothetical protein Tco_0746070 [Tanacetum coccineum]